MKIGDNLKDKHADNSHDNGGTKYTIMLKSPKANEEQILTEKSPLILHFKKQAVKKLSNDDTEEEQNDSDTINNQENKQVSVETTAQMDKEEDMEEDNPSDKVD